MSDTLLEYFGNLSDYSGGIGVSTSASGRRENGVAILAETTHTITSIKVLMLINCFASGQAAGDLTMRLYAVGYDAWVTLTDYYFNQRVTYGDDLLLYKCLSDHTSGTFLADLASGYWVLDETAPLIPSGDALATADVIDGDAALETCPAPPDFLTTPRVLEFEFTGDDIISVTKGSYYAFTISAVGSVVVNLNRPHLYDNGVRVGGFQWTGETMTWTPSTSSDVMQFAVYGRPIWTVGDATTDDDDDDGEPDEDGDPYVCKVPHTGTDDTIPTSGDDWGDYWIPGNGLKMRLIPFIYSSEIAYEMEFGDQYIRFFFDKAKLLDGSGDDVLVATPYSQEILFEIHTEQIADTMWVVHADYAQTKLTRTTTTSFDLSNIEFTGGPFRIRNDIIEDDGVTMTYDHPTDLVAVGSEGTLAASSPTFVAGHIGGLWGLTYPKDTVISKGSFSGTTTGTICAAIDVKGTVSFRTHGTWTADVEIQRNVNTAGWDTFKPYVGKDDLNAQHTWTEDSDGVQYRVVVTAHTSGTIGAEITLSDTTITGVVQIDSLDSASLANVTVKTALPVTAGLVATKRWAESAWSTLRSFPDSVTFLGERCVYAGGDTVWFSKVGSYENFTEGTKDADSFSLIIPSTNPIRWIKILGDAVVVGTSGDEWTISSNKLGTPITPTNFLIEPATTYGSSRRQPIKTNNVILFIDFVKRKIREFTLLEGQYVAPDLTELSEHITESGIKDIAFQKNPDEILWTTLDDGSFLSLVYERENNVVAWSPHPTTGEVQSVAVNPATDEDEVWISVERDVSGADVVLIEVFEPRAFDDIEDCHFVDSGVFYDGDDATVITVGTHLAGKTVHILADGVVIAPQVVSAGGTITLTTAAGKVHAGLQFTPKLEPMRPDIVTGDGTTHSSLVKVPEMGISFLNTLGATYGVTDDDQFDIDFDDPRWTNNSEITGLYTGDIIVAVDGGFSLDNNLIISNDDPLPMTVRALIPKIERTGR